MFYLGVDLGTTFIKAGILEIDELAVRDVRRIAFPSSVARRKHRKEYRAEEILEQTEGLIDEYLEIHGKPQGILLSTQMHGFLLAKRSGSSLTPYISWEDERCLEPVPGKPEKNYMELLGERIAGEEIDKAGMELRPGLAICGLFHWLENNPLLSGAVFCTLGDYIAWQLTGDLPRTHLTSAAATGLCNLTSGTWNRQILETLGCPRLTFPRIAALDQSSGLYRGIPIYPAVGDQQAAILGSLLVPEIDLSVNIGTGGQLARIVSEPDCGDYELRPYFADTYIKTITPVPAGRELDVLIGLVADIGVKIFECSLTRAAIWERIDELLSGSEASDLKVDTGFYPGMAGPDGGMIAGITGQNLKVEQLFHSALKSTAGYYVELHRRLFKRGELRRVVLSGGVVRKNPSLVEQLSSNFGVPTVLSPVEEDTLFGLLELALLCAGRVETLDEARRLAEKKWGQKEDCDD